MRNRKSYQLMKSIYDTVANKETSDGDKLQRIYEIMDGNYSFHSQKASDFMQEAVHFIISEENGEKRD